MTSVTPEPSGSASQPDQLRLLQGTTPGLLDPSQPKRVLRFSNSKLLFASFDPRTAYAGDVIPDIRKMSLKEDQPRPKRIVAETTPEGLSSWRFVPRAVLEEGVVEEGSWPRVVNICGEHVFCHQDQWDIYKLDPAYKCVVYRGFKYSSISRVELNGPQDTVFSEASGAKRSRRPSAERKSPSHDTKRSRPKSTDYGSSESDDDDEGEVERMIVDESAHPRKSRNGVDKRRKWSSREELEKRRNLRRQKIIKSQLKQGHNSQSNDPNASIAPGDDMSISDLQGGSRRAENNAKRKGPELESVTDEETKTDEEQEPVRQSGHKRMRTVSPNTVQHALKAMKAVREKRRQAKVHKVDESRRKAREEILLNDIRSDFPTYESNYFKDHQQSPAGDDVVSDEEELQPETISPEQAERENALAESIQKMKELDRDKPLWEAERKRREARERAEEEEKRARTEERRKAQAERERQQWEEEERVRRFNEERERQRREEEERVRRAEEQRKEEEARWQKEKRRRQRERWGTGLWTSQRALERFRVLSDAFDNAKFSPDLPIAFEDIPWPVLNPPRFSVEDVDWQAVETFFETVRTHMRTQDYKELVQKSHRRFHPDRWRARKVWTAVPDELERECLEVAANTVAQALTPIWMDAKSL